MLGVGQKFPEFSLSACVDTTKDMDKAFATISNDSYPGKWKVYFFWPMDFTFVCPTEIAAFGKLNGEFADRDTQLLGGSTDSQFVHRAWRNDHEDLRDFGPRGDLAPDAQGHRARALFAPHRGQPGRPLAVGRDGAGACAALAAAAA